jgi:hypothetical protein
MGRLFVIFAQYLSAEFVPQATAGGIRPSFADPRSAIGALGGA